MFDAISTFCRPLCAVLSRGDPLLKLATSDLSVLCSLTPCKPVELVISDGFNSETVTFTGCQNGAAIVARGTPQFKFPRGATVCFQWTANNVQANCTPCP